jgi:putative SOS response-associated peptidase YedK
MCGRFTSYHSSSEIAKAFNLADVPELEPRYNIAPTTEVATIIRAENREFKWLRWGLIPHWAKDKSIGNKLINARAETVAEKPSFKSAFKHSRCLIIASGFYEWQRQEKGKQPFLIQRTDNLPFAFAGLWSSWNKDGETIDSCTIITTEANKIMIPIHQRMPVILKSDDYDLWLDSTVRQPELLQPLLQPFDSDLLKAHPVTTKVNNPRNDSLECIRSLED